MNYGPISVSRMVFGFALTALVAFLPEAVILARSEASKSFLASAWENYGGVVVAAVIVVCLVGLARLAFMGRRAIRRA